MCSPSQSQLFNSKNGLSCPVGLIISVLASHQCGLDRSGSIPEIGTGDGLWALVRMDIFFSSGTAMSPHRMITETLRSVQTTDICHK